MKTLGGKACLLRWRGMAEPEKGEQWIFPFTESFQETGEKKTNYVLVR